MDFAQSGERSDGLGGWEVSGNGYSLLQWKRRDEICEAQRRESVLVAGESLGG